jgi:hypothetical protein
MLAFVVLAFGCSRAVTDASQALLTHAAAATAAGLKSLVASRALLTYAASATAAGLKSVVASRALLTHAASATAAGRHRFQVWVGAGGGVFNCLASVLLVAVPEHFQGCASPRSISGLYSASVMTGPFFLAVLMLISCLGNFATKENGPQRWEGGVTGQFAGRF